jgi:hypothetical protein
LDDFQSLFAGELTPEVLGKIMIELHRDYTVCTLEKLFGEGASAGANFNHQGFRLGTGRSRDALQNGASNKEVLT